MQTIFTIQDSIYILGTRAAKVAEMVSQACERVGLSTMVEALPPGVLAGIKPNPFLVICTSPADQAECQAISPATPWWLLADLRSVDRSAAFKAGCSQIMSSTVSPAEIDAQLSQLHTCRESGLLFRGISELSTIMAGELAGPLHYMSLGLRAMNRELSNLKPLFDDLHKAWFKTDKELLDKLRLILSVINLQQSWSELERTLEDYETGLNRLRDIHNFLRIGTHIEAENIRQFSLDEMVHTCLSLLKESRSDGIQIQESIPNGLLCRMKVGALFFGFASLLSILLDSLLIHGSGRGKLHLRAATIANEYYRLDLFARPENPVVGGLPMPDLALPHFIFDGLGISIRLEIRENEIAMGLDIPCDQEDSE